MKFRILLFFLSSHLIFIAYLFIYFSLIPYVQLKIYYNHSLNDNTSKFIKYNTTLANINTPAMIEICRNLMNETDLISNNDNISLIEINITNCRSKLLSRGESIDFAILGKAYSHLFSITNNNIYKEQAEYYILNSLRISPKRHDVQNINTISATYLN